MDNYGSKEYYNIITEEYVNLLKYPVVYPKIKIELMDYEENVIEEITQDISTDSQGSISVNYQQGVRYSCSITLINNFKKYTPSFNGLIWYNTKFKVYVGIANSRYEDADNYAVYWFSKGVYILTNPEILRDTSQKIVTLNGIDKFGIFGEETNYHELEGAYLIPAYTKVKDIIKDILSLERGNGSKLDPKPPIIAPAIGELQLPHEIKKSPESYFADILIEIGNMFACDIYYDEDGFLNFSKGNENLSMEFYSSLWDYNENNADYFSINSNLNFTDMYNVVKVIGNNPTSQLYQTVLKNTDPASPTNIYLIGERTKYIESTFCYSQQRTDDYAQYLLRNNTIIQNSLTFESIFIPHLKVNNIVTLTDSFYDYNAQRFIIQSLDIPLNPTATISVTATNTANIPYFE